MLTYDRFKVFLGYYPGLTITRFDNDMSILSKFIGIIHPYTFICKEQYLRGISTCVEYNNVFSSNTLINVYWSLFTNIDIRKVPIEHQWYYKILKSKKFWDHIDKFNDGINAGHLYLNKIEAKMKLKV